MKLYEVMFPFSAPLRIKGVWHTYGFQTTDKRKARGVLRKLRKHFGRHNVVSFKGK